MAKKHEEQVIDPEYPWKGDALDRKDTGEYFTKLLQDIHQPFVISVRSPFGTGKTNFLKRWKAHIVKEELNILPVYFDAWNTDFSSDPLAAVISKIIEVLPPDAQKNFVETVDAMTIYALKKFASYLTGGFSDKALEELKDLENFVKSKGDYEGYMKQIQAFQATEEVIQNFRAALENAVEGADGKILILVDELDRCRPTYAIELLECIKHLFNVPNVIFVIAVDDEQLVNAVSSVYGSNLNGDGYLRKFFDWQLNLPEPDPEQYARYLIKQFQLEEFFKKQPEKGQHFYALQGAEAFIIAFSTYSKICNLTLRQQEQCFINLDLILRSLDEGQLPFSEALGVLLAIRCYYGEDSRFQRLCNRRINRSENFFNKDQDSIFSHPNNSELLRKSFPNKYHEHLEKYLFDNTEQRSNEIKTLHRRRGQVGTQIELTDTVYKLGQVRAIEEELNREEQSRLSQLIYDRIEQASLLTEKAA